MNDVLDFSKIEAGKLSLGRAPFDVKDVAERCLHSIEGPARAKSLAAAVRVSPDVSRWLTGDAAHLDKILTHLLSNAVKFTREGGVELDVAGRGPVTGGVQALRFTIRDTGIGIDQEAQKKLFSPFTRVEGNGLTAESGTGLGLTIAKRLVEAMGGSIMCSSESGRGSCFTVDLAFPICAAPENPQAGSGRVGPARILVADDNPVNQTVLQGMLRHLGHTVTVVSDGKGALEAIRKETYDIVLMDCEMPVLDGMDSTRMIRRTPGLDKVPIIALSAHCREDREAACRAAGMSDYLSKPVVPQTLRETLLRWL